MILHINLSEDKELRNAILGMVQEAVRTNFRDIMKNTQTDEILKKVKDQVDLTMARIQIDYSYEKVYNMIQDKIVQNILNRINIQSLQKEVIDTIADRIYQAR